MTNTSTEEDGSDTDGGIDRRRFIKGGTAAAVTVGIGSGAVAFAQAQSNGSTTIELGGEIPGWMGRSPSSIKGTTNPTLKFTAGEEVTVTWENIDGAPHNFQVLDSDGDVLHETEIISQQGATQTTTFTATEEMVEYNCVVHPSRMRGDISVSSGGGEQEGGEAQNASNVSSSQNASNASAPPSNESANMNVEVDPETGLNSTSSKARPEPASSPTKTFEMTFEDGHWVGQSPSSIKGKKNPTLNLESGKTYEVNWTTTESHTLPTLGPNFVITTESGSLAARTDALQEKGATQTVTFVATDDLSEYMSEASLNAQGGISVGGPSNAGGNGKAKTGNGKAKSGNGKAKSGDGKQS